MKNKAGLWAVGIGIITAVIIIAALDKRRARTSYRSYPNLNIPKLKIPNLDIPKFDSAAFQKSLDLIKARLGKATGKGVAAPTAKAKPAETFVSIDPFERFRSDCRLRRCVSALRTLAARKPRDDATRKVMIELWPKAIEEARRTFPGDPARMLLDLGAELGLASERLQWLGTLRRDQCVVRRECLDAAKALADDGLPQDKREAIEREILPRAIDEAASGAQLATARTLAERAASLGLAVDRGELERRLERASLTAVLIAGRLWKTPDYRGDAVIKPSSSYLRDERRWTAVTGPGGLAWYRIPQDGSVFYVLQSAVSRGRYGNAYVTSPGPIDSIRILRDAKLPWSETKGYWKRLYDRTLAPFLLVLLIYLIATLVFAPRWTAKLLWALRLRRLARLVAWWACHRRRAASPTALVGPAIDLARYTVWRVHKPMRAEARDKALGRLEQYLRSAAYLRPKAGAWLGRILLLQGRLDDGIRAADAAHESKPSNRTRIEKARLAIAQGKVGAAGSLMAAVPAWQALSADSMYLRAVTLAHAGRIRAARVWFFLACRDGLVRRQGGALRLWLRARLGADSAIERSAERAAKAGVAVVSASAWLARRARERGELERARRWAESGLAARPRSLTLEIEVALAQGGLEAIVAVAKRNARSCAALEAALRAAADAGERHAYLDARLDDEEGATAGLWLAKGDYAHAGAETTRALQCWRRAGELDRDLLALALARARVLFDEALAHGRPELALELARVADLDAALVARAEQRHLLLSIDRARRGLPVSGIPRGAKESPVATALWHLLRGDTAAASSALAPLGEATRRVRGLIEDARALTAEERAELDGLGGSRIGQRAEPLREACARLRAALAGKRYTECLADFELVASGAKVGGASDAGEAQARGLAMLRLLASEGDRAENLRVVAEHHPDREVRALAAHDRALALEPKTDGRRAPQKRWRAFVEAWDAVFADPAYAAHLRRRILELDDPRLSGSFAEELLAEARDSVAERLRPFLENRLADGEPVPGWVHESPVAEAAAQVLINARTRDAEEALERAAASRTDPKSAPRTWREEGRAMLDACAAVGLLAVAKERADALRERVAGCLINMGVDANAIGAYDDAVDITEAASGLAQNPEHRRLCDGNLAVYRSNRALKLAPPGR